MIDLDELEKELNEFMSATPSKANFMELINRTRLAESKLADHESTERMFKAAVMDLAKIGELLGSDENDTAPFNIPEIIAERDQLRAKLSEMEVQEPVGTFKVSIQGQAIISQSKPNLGVVIGKLVLPEFKFIDPLNPKMVIRELPQHTETNMERITLTNHGMLARGCMCSSGQSCTICSLNNFRVWDPIPAQQVDSENFAEVKMAAGEFPHKFIGGYAELKDIPVGTKLYLHPPQAAIPDGWKDDWKSQVMALWACVRKNNSSIPDDYLDSMRDILLSVAPSLPVDPFSMGYSLWPNIPTYEMCKAGGFNWEGDFTEGSSFPERYEAMRKSISVPSLPVEPLVGSEYVKVIATQETIDAFGIGRRILSGGVYQNLPWVESSAGAITVCDEKGCHREIPETWVMASTEEGKQ